MSTIQRWLSILRLLPPLALASMPVIGPRRARGRFPTTEGDLKAPGLHGKVEVIRDRFGVPHIFAENEHDLFFAQGYVHAQDRLFQLELLHRIGEGTLAAMLGPAAVPADRVLRTLGLNRMAKRGAALVQGDARAVLTAYAEGVNARIAGPDPLPLEFDIFGIKPTPWTVEATLLRGNLLALGLSGNHRIELLRAAMIAEVGEAITAALLPPNAPITPIITTPGVRGLTAMEGLDAVDALLGDPNITSGSNNWVVHGSRTESGKPLLANDVHIGLGLPSNFYENGLHGGRFDGVGFSLPGVPMLLFGHNGRIAWGMSNLGPDTQDFYVEKLDNPDNPRRYEWKGEQHDLEIIREVIEVRGGDPVPVEIKCTRHGPLMNEAMTRFLKGAEPLALRWALSECAPLLTSVLHLNLARSWDDFRAALALWDSPGQNFVYADTEGNIGYQATGKIPVRAPGHAGIDPVPGWTGENEWQGFIPFDELPHAFNPEAGYLATANNKPVPDDYPHHLAHHWFPGYRAKRITDLIAAGERHTIDSMRRIQLDTHSLPAEAIRPYLLAISPAAGAESQALDAVRSWDLRYEPDRTGAVIFQAFYVHLLRNVLGKHLGPTLVERYLASEYERHGSLHMPVVIDLLSRPDDEVFVRPRRGEPEARDALLSRSFTEGVAWLRERFGPDQAAWTWGRAHTMTLEHMLLGKSGPAALRRVWNTRTLAARGDNYTVDGASFLWNKPFTVVHGTAQRMVIDLADLSRSVGVHAPGQVEHLHHPHRDDFFELMSTGRDHPLLFSRAAVEEHAEHRLILSPEEKA